MAVPRYHFDLYPRDDPRDGTRLVRFTNLQSAKFRLEANGVGVGEFSIRSTDAEALHIDPRGLQYVRVVEEGITEAERVVGGFWLETGDFAALTEDSTKLLKFGGPGTLAYLSREVLWSRAYNYAADNIIDESGTWHFYNQASLAGGDYLGGVAFRIITEGLTFAASPSEVDDKPDTAIPDVQLGSGLGAYSDSAGAAWTVPSGEFKAQVGDTLYSIVKRLMEAGLYIEMNPDTFELNVWERGAANSRGDSKTGSAWAVVDPMTDERVIRFQSAPLDGDEALGNVKSDAKRSVTPYLLASTVLAGDNGVYSAESNALDIKWHRYYPSSVQNADTLSHMADSQLSARGDAADTLRVRIKLGNDPANGVYYPFEWEPFADTGLDGVVMVNDTVTVHTGTGQWDYNEDTFPVAAITISVREGGDWDCWLDLGAAYSSMAERAFQSKGTAPHSHPPNPQLCRPGSPGTFSLLGLLGAVCSNSGVNSASEYPAWSGDNEERVEITSAITVPVGGSAIVIGGWNSAPDRLTAVYDQRGNTWVRDAQHEHTASSLDDKIEIWRCNVTTAIQAGDWIRFAGNVGSSLLPGSEWGGRCLGAYGYLGTLAVATVGTGVGGISTAPSISTPAGGLVVAGISIGSQDAATGLTGDPDWDAMVPAVDSTGTGTAGKGIYAQQRLNAPVDTWTIGISPAADWAAISVAYTTTAAAGIAGDGPAELVGTSPRAARCDHNHEIDDLLTDETDTALVLKPDGIGGVEWGADATGGGGGGAPALVGVKAWRSTTQSITANTETAVSFDSENFDTDGFHDPGSNPTRLTVPSGKAGVYMIVGQMRWAPNSNTSGRYAHIKVNGTVYVGGQFHPGSNQSIDHNVSVIVDLAVGDYVEMVVFTGATMNVNILTSSSPSLSMVLVGA